MADDEADSPGASGAHRSAAETPATRAKKAAARERLAAALRDNLRRRKAQSRGRDTALDTVSPKKPPD